MASVEELTADLEELKALLNTVKRDNTKRIIDREIKQLKPIVEQAKSLKEMEEEKTAANKEEEKKQEI